MIYIYNNINNINNMSDSTNANNYNTPKKPTRPVSPNAPKKTKVPREWWMGEKGMCEVCSLRRATVNLELKYGSHRECQICWND